MFARSQGRALARCALDAANPSAVSLPSFLVPALHSTSPPPAARQFSVSTSRPSKLGRTPISIPPGVEVTVSEPWLKKDATTYLKIMKRTVTVQGPLG
jgi:large subunit ribosomal protein L6